ncbi:hypothetical protein C0992_001447 [Termitomyces sp. T32_za158]|nr:hypothetical protein C0992_001447 [Termitomyces sp. T32_za158]
MVDTRRSASAKSKPKATASTTNRQRTLLDLFPAKLAPPEHVTQDEDEPARPTPAETNIAPVVEKLRQSGQENPIIVEKKPLRPLGFYKPGVSKPLAPLAPLFAPRRTKTAPAFSPEIVLLELPDEAAKPKPAPRPTDVVAPFPNREWQHVRGPQHAFTASSIPYDRLIKHVPSPTLPSYKPGSLKQFLVEEDTKPPRISTLTLDKDTYLDTIPHEHREHPAILRVTTASEPEGSAHRLWVDKWRPTRAAEILGNEDNAIYLRDWIRALELELAGKDAAAPVKAGTKRPRVVRQVEKRGKKKRRADSEEDDSWIVYDSEAPEALAEPAFTSLTNTIILTGPIGTGKTAAVYACAEELGWYVLEVYPGIGRRNGAGIDSLIGDAGKNHHVRTESVEVGPRQSLILLEEVDILFKDDTNFWPAVTNFIKECKRPVICTCNGVCYVSSVDVCSCVDISLVPTEDLPLQTVLRFEACAGELAASYLQALCVREDARLVDRKTLVGMYVGDWDEIPSADLRRTINRLECGMSAGDADVSGRQDDLWPRSLLRARVEHQAMTVEALEGIVPASVLATRREEVQLEYLSRVRAIVAAEDEHERGWVRQGRMTRNSGGMYERIVVVRAEARVALGRTGLSEVGGCLVG